VPSVAIRRNAREIPAAMRSAPWRRAVERFGIVVDHRDRAGFTALLAREYAALGQVLQAMGVRPE